MTLVRKMLMDLQGRSLPDELQLPSFCAALVRTGDLLYVPAGSLILEKCVHDDAISFRTLSLMSDCLFIVVRSSSSPGLLQDLRPARQ